MRNIILSIFTLWFFSALQTQAATSTEPCLESTQINLLHDLAPIIDQSFEKLSAQEPPRKKEAGIYGKDNRFSVQKDVQYPFTTLGKLSWDGAHCTAVMVSRCHILTAHHCISKASEAAHAANQPLTLGFTSANGKSSSGVISIVAGENPGIFEEGDWAAARLYESIGDQTGWMGVSQVTGQNLPQWVSSACVKDRKFVVAGYNSDFKQGHVLSVDSKVEILRSEKDNILRFRANSFTGSSGGPIWRYDCQEKPEIVGINTISMAHPKSLKQVKLPAQETKLLAGGVASDAFYSNLKRFMKENPCP